MTWRFCVVWRIGGQKSHPEFHRVRGEWPVYRLHCLPHATPVVGLTPTNLIDRNASASFHAHAHAHLPSTSFLCSSQESSHGGRRRE